MCGAQGHTNNMPVLVLSLDVGDEFSVSPFEAAFQREAAVRQVKAEKGKYARQVL